MKFIHTSDWQIGMTRAFLSQEAAARYSQARIDAIRGLGQLAEQHDAQFMVVAGDVFESNQLSAQTLSRALDALNSVPVPVFLLPGNHDPLDASSIFRSRAFRDQAREHIIVLTDSTPIPVPGLANVEVIGAPWFSKRPAVDLCAQALKTLQPAPGVSRILLGHGQVDSLSPDQSQPGVVSQALLEQALAQGLVQYVALGDRHSLTNVGNSGRLCYSGTPLVTDFDEVDPNQALLVELDNETCTLTPHNTGFWDFQAVQRDINGPEDLAAFAQWLDAIRGKECTVLKVGFTGSVNLALAAELDTLLDAQAQVFASLKRRARTTDLAVIPDALDDGAIALSGYADATWKALLVQAASDDTATDALRLMYRLAGGAGNQGRSKGA
ncbi:exonuclease SbcCD subunit D [Haliea sp. E1-2-M8]|uniref:metallophosphoesterase family protein n=1 Tax=Haliea sp. E1-2-M8 TaxID=3064706 RepID=UPI002716F694|nr:exonuclease SbcCD subunit D [Haliea sp. E1-2-M8]MDO8863965.1 exonuclease SbcCD subunit D [Haliea sp. E1-2-M8]